MRAARAAKTVLPPPLRPELARHITAPLLITKKGPLRA